MTIKSILKHNKVFYSIYYYLFSSLLKVIGLFVRTDNSLVLLVSYGGKKFDDSPKFVYEYIKENKEYSWLKTVWAFKNPEDFPEVDQKVRIDSLSYFLTALKAKYWITNSSCARGLKMKKQDTINILFQHGMAGIKKIGRDIENKKKTYRQLFEEEFDYIFIEGKEESAILEKAWNIDKSRLYITGLPRNDDLLAQSEYEITKIKRKIGLPASKKVILYAPTFREESVDSKLKNVLTIPIDFQKWERYLSDTYVLLVTAHYEVECLQNTIPDNRFVFNVFNYPTLNDLLKISDILITDYSSIAFDYSILERPILCYGYDYDEYMENRGTYNDLNTLFSHGVIQNEEDLLYCIENLNYEEECKYTREKIKNRFIAAYGDATEKAIQIIFSHDPFSRIGTYLETSSCFDRL